MVGVATASPRRRCGGGGDGLTSPSRYGINLSAGIAGGVAIIVTGIIAVRKAGAFPIPVSICFPAFIAVKFPVPVTVVFPCGIRKKTRSYNQ